jgi:hypothetical protein
MYSAAGIRVMRAAFYTEKIGRRVPGLNIKTSDTALHFYDKAVNSRYIKEISNSMLEVKAENHSSSFKVEDLNKAIRRIFAVESKIMNEVGDKVGMAAEHLFAIWGAEESSRFEIVILNIGRNVFSNCKNPAQL